MSIRPKLENEIEDVITLIKQLNWTVQKENIYVYEKKKDKSWKKGKNVTQLVWYYPFKLFLRKESIYYIKSIWGQTIFIGTTKRQDIQFPVNWGNIEYILSYHLDLSKGFDFVMFAIHRWLNKEGEQQKGPTSLFIWNVWVNADVKNKYERNQRKKRNN